MFLCFLIVEQVKRSWYEVFLESLIEFSSDCIQSWAFLGEALMSALITLLVMNIFEPPISSWLHFGKLYEVRNSSISSELPSFLEFKFL